jgi:hypothetical protein
MDETYKKVDPWDYQKNPDDFNRKSIILNRLNPYAPFIKALDIGCGEGWITGDLPAEWIYGFDVSDVAMSRLPEKIFRMTEERLNLHYKYDLIIATGVIYPQYDWRWVLETIDKSASGIVLTCNITTVECPEISRLKNQIHVEEFDYYNGFQQRERLRIFDYREIK